MGEIKYGKICDGIIFNLIKQVAKRIANIRLTATQMRNVI